MKTIIKLIVGLMAGIAAGFVIAAVLILLFTDTTLVEYFDNLRSADAAKAALAALAGVGAFAVSLAILIPAHEAGHLVCGLWSGYGFVSFRIFNLTFIKEDGHVRVKRFSVAGTGGQCLLTPPDLPLDKIPTMWYNAGGVLANIALLLLALPLLWVDMHPYLFESIVIFCITDIFLILINGVPMKLGGIGNDAYNMIYLRKNNRSKRGLVVQLRTNALLQGGMRPKDMPDEWFEWETDVDYSNPLEVAVPLMYASRLIDEMRWEEAYLKFDYLYGRKESIIGLYVNEIACELAFCAMMTGRIERASTLLDVKIRKYVDTYANVMSSKMRVACGIALFLDDDMEKARRIYESLSDTKENYLLQGEVNSDIAIIRWMLAHTPAPHICPTKALV